MPDVLTHILCGEKAVKSISDSNIKKEILKRSKLFNIGCQGPDIFIYYRSWPRGKRNRIDDLAHMLHEERTGQFFIEAIKFIDKCNKGSNEYYDMLAYILGFVCHFNMDKVAHPFIFYFGGINDGTKQGRKYSNYHKRLEIALDSLIYNRYKNKDAYKYPVYKLLNIDYDMPSIICEFYKEVFNKIYSTNISLNLPRIAVKDMVKILKILFDPYGIKKKVTNLCYNSSNFCGYLSDAIYPKKLNPKIDYMNLNHVKWYNPIDKKMVYNKSFIELFGIGVQETTYYFNKIIDYYNNQGIDYEQIKELFKDISYITGMQSGRDKDMKYYKSLFD